MKRLLLTFLASLSLGILLHAQICTPDPAFTDSLGVFPRPYHPVESPAGGITECAVIGQPFSFNFTVAVGDTLTLGAISIPIDSVTVTSVDSLPPGISYACIPSNCHYPKNSIGCAVLYGTPTGPAGLYNLTINGKAYSGALPLSISFPNDQLAPGKYTIQVLASPSEPCSTTGSREPLAEKLSFQAAPNPASGWVKIQASSKLAGEFQLKVADLLGNQVHQSGVSLSLGSNSFDFDGSQLASGVYLISLQNEHGSLTQKLVVQR